MYILYVYVTHLSTHVYVFTYVHFHTSKMSIHKLVYIYIYINILYIYVYVCSKRLTVWLPDYSELPSPRTLDGLPVVDGGLAAGHRSTRVASASCRASKPEF